MQHTFQPSGVCPRMIAFELDGNVVHNVAFLGGCNGNLQGVSKLVCGQHIDDVISKIDGIRCGTKSTSCPDQLCRALEQLKQAPLSN